MAVDSLQTPRRPTERSDDLGRQEPSTRPCSWWQPERRQERPVRNLTQRYVTVSNFPGTTVEIARARAAFNGREWTGRHPRHQRHLARAEDAQVTREMIDRNPDATIVQVADAKNLRRALLLTLQLAEWAGRWCWCST